MSSKVSPELQVRPGSNPRGKGPIDDDVAVEAAVLAGSKATVQMPDTETIGLIIPLANGIICGINH